MLVKILLGDLLEVSKALSEKLLVLFAADMAKSAFDSAKKALGIKSPSRVMRDKVGRFVPAGLAVGMIDNLSIVEKHQTS